MNFRLFFFIIFDFKSFLHLKHCIKEIAEILHLSHILVHVTGLCRTSEIFGVSEFVIGNLSYLNDHVFQSLSVTAEKWIPITEVQNY